MEKKTKMWLRCETISDRNAMKKSRHYNEEVEKTMENLLEKLRL